MSIFELSDQLVNEVAELSPIAATGMGIPGYDHLWQDFSPGGIRKATAILEKYRDEALLLPASDDRWEGLARRILLDFIDQSLSEISHGDPLRDMNNTASPLQLIVQVFDLMDTSTPEGCSNVPVSRRCPTCWVAIRRHSRKACNGDFWRLNVRF